MKKNVIIALSFDNQPETQCIPLTNDELGLGLCKKGITWREQADAMISIDSHHELIIRNMGQERIEIERNGRKHILPNDHSIPLSVNDVIRIGSEDQHTFDIRHIYRTSRPLIQIHRLSKIAMIACSASIVMCSAACQRTSPQNATQPSTCQEMPASGNPKVDDAQDPNDLSEDDLKRIYYIGNMGIMAPSKEDLEKEDVIRREPSAIENLHDSVSE